MAEKIAESFAIAEDDAFLNGTGIEEPKGILALEKGKNVNAIERLDGKLETSAIKDLIDSINPFYGQNLSFLISKDVESKIKSLKEENGRHIWQARLLEAERNTIFGIPVFVSNFMPSNQILFGNFEKGYTIVEKFGNYMMRDPYTKRPFIKFYTSKKIGGDVIDGNAFKILNIKPS
jgi:HK97 family phage major capsid protein